MVFIEVFVGCKIDSLYAGDWVTKAELSVSEKRYVERGNSIEIFILSEG